MVRIVGRDPELRHLLAGAQRARSGAAALIMIEGEPGIGKTRLLDEVASRLGSEGWKTFACSCSELDVDRPFAPVSAGLADLMDQLGSDAPGELFEAADLLRQAATRGSGLENQAQRVRSLIVEGLHDLSRTGPLLVLFDDTHWIDDASAGVLWGIARRRTKPVLTLATFRPSEREAVRALRRGMDEGGSANIVVSALPRNEAEVLATEILGARPNRVVNQLLDDAAGNPLFITELLQGDVESVNLADTETNAGVIPTSLRNLVLRRLDGLGVESQATLFDASLSGLTFDVAELAAIRERTVRELMTALEPAIRLRIVVEHGTQLAFQHAIVQAIVREQHPDALRRSRHHEVSQRLIEVRARWTRVAEHLMLSGPTASPECVAVFRRAAEEVRPLSLVAALTWFERALEFATNAAERFDLQMEVAAVLILVGRVVDAEQLCEASWSLCSTPEDEIRLRITLAALNTMAGRTRAEDAAEHLDRVLELLPPLDSQRVETLGWRAVLHLVAGRLDEAEQTAQLGRTIEIEGDRLPMMGRIHEAESLIALLRGDSGRALTEARAALAAFDQQRNVFTWVMTPHFACAMAMLNTSPIADVIEMLQDGFRACEQAGHAMARLHLEPLMSIAHFARGDIATARSSVTATIERNNDWRSGGVALPSATGLAAYIAMLSDDLDSARTLADQTLEELIGGGAQAGSGDFSAWCVACVREADGDVVGARELLCAVWELVARDASLFAIAPDLVRLTVDEQPDFARDVVERAEARALRSGGAVDRAQALASRGFLERNVAFLDEAALEWERVGWHLSPTRIRDFAIDLCAGGPMDELRRRIAEVTLAWERMELAQPIRLLEERSRHLGVRSKRPVRANYGPDSLSQTERVVIGYVGDGLTNKQIAQRLYVSHRTIDTHVSHALAKLGVSSRVQLAGFATADRIRV